MGSICGGGGWGSMGRRQLCTYMYDVKSSSGVVTVVHGVRRGMGFLCVSPLCTTGVVQ